MTHKQAIAVRSSVTKILQAFDVTDYKVAIRRRTDDEFEVHAFTAEKGEQLYKIAFLWRALEDLLGGTLSILSYYDAGTIESDIRESFKLW